MRPVAALFVLSLVPIACKRDQLAEPTSPPAASHAEQKAPDGLVGFEGEIDLQVEATGDAAKMAGERWDIRLKIKDDRVRMETKSQLALIHPGKGKAYAVTRSTKQYLEEKTGLIDPTSTGGTVTRTQKTDKVLGRSCTVMIIEEPALPSRIEACVAKGTPIEGLGLFAVSGMAGGVGLNAALREGVPLRIEIHHGKERVAKVEATRIEEMKVADADVDLPQDYTKQE